jgi:hypothetical protein
LIWYWDKKNFNSVGFNLLMILVYIHTYKVTGVKDPDGPLGLTPKLI